MKKRPDYIFRITRDNGDIIYADDKRAADRVINNYLKGGDCSVRLEKVMHIRSESFSIATVMTRRLLSVLPAFEASRSEFMELHRDARKLVSKFVKLCNSSGRDEVDFYYSTKGI